MARISSTNWDKIVSGKELAKAKGSRARTYIVDKQRIGALPALEAEGWEFVSEYKDGRFVKVKKEKPQAEQFEDKVWSLFAGMNFTHMNVDANFRMAFDYQNPAATQQIDVFAADDETVIIVECKSAAKPRDGVFKKEIEAFHGQMDGLQKEARRQFPNCKVKFIWAVHNYIMSPTEVKRLEEWNIELFDDNKVDYYIELVKHLGSCAKYQLLGALFAKQTIKNMECRIPAIRGSMGGHTYYSFSIEPEKLLKIGYVLHHNKANESMMPTYQRIIKKKRLLEVRKFINNGGYFPNSIIISIDTNGRGVRFDQSADRVDSSISKIGILHLPQQYRSAYIIDGQHRLYGYSDSDHAMNNTIPVVAFVDLDKSEQIQLFMDINENQKAVPKSLRATLDADTLWVSDDYNERRKALRSKLAQMLGERITSPLYNRVVIGENEKTSERCITIEALQQALRRCHFFTTYTKKTIPSEIGTFDTGDIETTCDAFYPFIEACLRYMKNQLPEEWEKGDKGMITLNRGIQGVIRVVDDVTQLLISQEKINTRRDKTEYMVAEVEYYLEPLVEFIKEMPLETRDEMRHIFGGGGDTKFWRTFQQAIAKKRPDFMPDGLAEWIENETKSYNESAFAMVDAIESFVKAKCAELLQNQYAKNWQLVGLPKDIARRLMNEATEQTLTNAENGIHGAEVEPWEFVTLADIQRIITYSSHWQNLFEGILADPLTPKGDKTVRTNWLITLGALSKRNHNTYSVPKTEYEWVKSLYDYFITDNN